jgi:putative ABC transport system permease protein
MRCVAFLVVTGLTGGIGLLNSRGIYDRPPLDVLRGAEA